MKTTIRFIPEDPQKSPVTAEAEAGEKLTQVAYRAGVLIQQTCGGKAACTDCKIVVKEGISEGFEPAVGAELRQLGNVYFITHERLACQSIVKGNAAVFIPVVDRKKRGGRLDKEKGHHHGKDQEKESHQKEGFQEKGGKKNR